MFPHLAAFLVRLAVSAAVLMAAVAWVSPKNPANTFGRALVVSFFLSLAWYVTLAKFLWILLLPLLIYGAVWVAAVMVAYGLGLGKALLLALAGSFLSWLVAFLFGIRTF